MTQKFRLFVQKHDNGTYTVTVPGLREVPGVSRWDEEGPETSHLAAYGLLLEEVKQEVREALEKWLSRTDPDELHHYNNYREEQRLEKIEVELRPKDLHGRKRRDRVMLKVSLLVTRDESDQYLVSVPKLTDPPLVFYYYALEELEVTATRELAAYFGEHALEDLLRYQHQRQEFLDTIEVSFTPPKPQKEKKKSAEEQEVVAWALKSSAVNLSARAKERKLERAYRREAEVGEVLNVLAADSDFSPSC